MEILWQVFFCPPFILLWKFFRGLEKITARISNRWNDWRPVGKRGLEFPHGWGSQSTAPKWPILSHAEEGHLARCDGDVAWRTCWTAGQQWRKRRITRGTRISRTIRKARKARKQREQQREQQLEARTRRACKLSMAVGECTFTFNEWTMAGRSTGTTTTARTPTPKPETRTKDNNRYIHFATNTMDIIHLPFATFIQLQPQHVHPQVHQHHQMTPLLTLTLWTMNAVVALWTKGRRRRRMTRRQRRWMWKHK